MPQLLINPTTINFITDEEEMSSAEYQILLDQLNAFKTQVAQQDNINSQNFEIVNQSISNNENSISAVEKKVLTSKENLLINPRGLINQASEAQGILTAYQYFCDGWKAGADGAEVYIENGTFNLISGSVYQIVENKFNIGEKLKGNININSGDLSFKVYQIDNAQDSDIVEIQNTNNVKFEISGVGIFEKPVLIVGDESSQPLYFENPYDTELERCKRFYEVVTKISDTRANYGANFPNSFPFCYRIPFKAKVNVPAITYAIETTNFEESDLRVLLNSDKGFIFGVHTGSINLNSSGYIYTSDFYIDARL